MVVDWLEQFTRGASGSHHARQRTLYEDLDRFGLPQLTPDIHQTVTPPVSCAGARGKRSPFGRRRRARMRTRAEAGFGGSIS